MEPIYWIALGLIVHSYVVYPVSLPFLGWLFSRKRLNGNPNRYKVTMVVAAHNEEDVIEEKIQNTFDLEFPEENLEILIGSDASTDATNTIVGSYSDRVRLIEMHKRGGKSAVLNQLVPEASGEILVFCDANTMLLKNALQKLLAPFEDSNVGCVCGRLILKDSSESALGIGETVYWNLESEIKKLEGQLGIVIGANGGIYAIRRELFEKIPAGKMVMDDFFITTQVLRRGKEAIYEPQAIGSEETSRENFGEFHRKVRIGHANFNLLKNYLGLLNPARGLVAYGFFSHKFLRWTGPVTLFLLLLANGFLLKEHFFYRFSFTAQLMFYLMALFGYLQDNQKDKSGVLLLPYYFVSMNLALLIGMARAFFEEDSGGMWTRIERTTQQAQQASAVQETQG